MSQFQPAFAYVMQFEDAGYAYADVPDNKGRAISGINSLEYPEEWADIVSLPQASRGAAVAQFYQQKFFQPLNIGGLTSQDVANRVMDEAVNGGLREGQVLLQRAVKDCGGSVVVDGCIGPATLEAANALDADALEAAYRSERVAFYTAVLRAHPEDAPYRAIWLARAEA